jgi:hypothetical protein
MDPQPPSSDVSSVQRRSVLERVESSLQWMAESMFGREDAGPGLSVLRLLAFVWGMVGFGLLSLLIPAATHAIDGNYREALTVVGVGLFVAGAATAFGSMLGFLFGVPKASTVASSDERRSLGDEQSYVPNTNLEAISDWLTKVIVGAGLVQVREIAQWIDEIGQVAGNAMGGTEFMRVVATCLLVHNVLMGFFQGFLVAYMYLPKAFAAARGTIRRSTPNMPPQPRSGEPTSG